MIIWFMSKNQTNEIKLPHQASLEALKEALGKRKAHKVPTSKLIKMAKFMLKNNHFQFTDKVYLQILETAIGTKFAPPHAWIFISKVSIFCMV